ncbi:MAG: hypothetical protein ABSA47_05405 [Verrucomicrobiota bacterium]|jgi:hypothetical protein
MINFKSSVGFSLCLVTIPLILGCHSKEERESRNLAELRKKTEGLYELYLSGDYKQAKDNLDRIVELNQITEQPLNDRAHALFFTYARMYALERTVGNDNLAEAELVKSRYWALLEAESGGHNDTEAGEYVKPMTGDFIFNFIVQWDERASGGRGPNYMKGPVVARPERQ